MSTTPRLWSPGSALTSLLRILVGLFARGLRPFGVGVGLSLGVGFGAPA